jgi:hypothetical protein
MTNSTDEYLNRIASDKYGEGQENTVGVPIDGFADPTGEYPKRDYFYGSSVNEAARGTKVNNLSLRGGDLSVSIETPPQKTSSFPFNDVRETSSGHVWEMDDTPGGERILIKHRLGGGIELRADGSFSSSSPGNRVTVTGGQDTVIVDGRSSIVIKGDASLTVSGDYNVNVGGNYNLDVAGSERVNVRQSSRKRIGTNVSTIVAGDADHRVAGNSTSLVLGTRNQAVKGSHKILTAADLEISSKDTTITSEAACIISSMSMSASAGNMSIIGVNGTIGGERITHHGSVFAGPKFYRSGIDGQPGSEPALDATFHGTLVGKASEAFTAEFAQKADEAHSAHWAAGAATAAQADVAGTAGSAGSTPGPMLHAAWLAGAGVNHGVSDINVNPGGSNNASYFMNHSFVTEGPGSAIPTFAILAAVLSMGSTSIRKVTIDDNDELLNQITRTPLYGDEFSHTPTTPEIRSKLRTMTGQKKDVPGSLIEQLIAEGRLSPSYANNVPPSTPRVAAGLESSARFGYNVLGNNPMENRSKRFKTK